MSHIANYFTKTLLFVLFITVLINVRTSAQSETSEIIIIEEVCSFDELINRFKGKVVFIDFWASWCNPCIEEFRFNADLNLFCAENEIVRLFVAMEKQSPNNQPNLTKEHWKNLVTKHNLEGFNYYSELKTDFFWDISKKIMKGKLSLPRFAIIDKNGAIAERKAACPSDSKKLRKQLLTYCQN